MGTRGKRRACGRDGRTLAAEGSTSESRAGQQGRAVPGLALSRASPNELGLVAVSPFVLLGPSLVFEGHASSVVL